LMVKIGQGLAEPGAVDQALREGSFKVNELAPPQGLCLVAVEY